MESFRNTGTLVVTPVRLDLELPAVAFKGSPKLHIARTSGTSPASDPVPLLLNPLVRYPALLFAQESLTSRSREPVRKPCHLPYHDELESPCGGYYWLLFIPDNIN